VWLEWPMGGASMPGMMSDAVMSRLANSKGSAFDELFLTEMIAHHRGALAMARTELPAGTSSAGEALARSITGGQTRKIAEIKVLLARSSRYSRRVRQTGPGGTGPADGVRVAGSVAGSADGGSPAR